MAKTETEIQTLTEAPEGATLFQSRYGKRPIYHDDTVIVGYPKSGTTWMRFLIANMLRPDLELTFRNLQEVVPSIHQPQIFDPNFARPRFLKTHFPAYDAFPRTIYIYRDGRDVMVSHYHYAIQKWEHAKKRFTSRFGRFLRENYPHKHYGAWHEHVQRAFDFADQHPDRILIVRYEDMLQNPHAGAAKIAEFCGFKDLTDEEIETAVSKCRFEKLQKDEVAHGSIPSRKENFRFFRSGKAGQWGELFSKSDMDFFMKKAGPTLKKLGYIE
jgi:hypothetical protein